MGREQASFTVYATVARHNSEQDRIDDDLWEELQRRVRAICREHRYESIQPDGCFALDGGQADG